MSHRDTCPDRWDAQREGERAQEFGRSRSSNPYEDMWGSYSRSEQVCPEAADAWRSGYRRAEMREEEQREEDAAQHRAEMRRAELQAEEEYAYEMSARQEREYYEEQERARYEEPPTREGARPMNQGTQAPTK